VQHQIHDGRGSLVCCRVHEEPGDGEVLAVAERASCPGVLPHRRDDRIGFAFFLAPAVQPQAREERHRGPGAVAAVDVEGLGLTAEPVVDHACVVPDSVGELQQRLSIVSVGILVHAAVSGEGEVGARHTARAVEVLHGLQRRQHVPAGVGHHPLEEMCPHPVVHGLVARWVAPAQVLVERIAHEIVRPHAERAGLDERERSEPVEQQRRIVTGVLAGEDRAEQVDRGPVGVGAHLERLPMPG
jgi:hypothetical protein